MFFSRFAFVALFLAFLFYFVLFYSILRQIGRNKAYSPHFHVFSYTSCVNLTQLHLHCSPALAGVSVFCVCFICNVACWRSLLTIITCCVAAAVTCFCVLFCYFCFCVFSARKSRGGRFSSPTWTTTSWSREMTRARRTCWSARKRCTAQTDHDLDHLYTLVYMLYLPV